MLEPGKDGKERINDSSQRVRDRLEGGGVGGMEGGEREGEEERERGGVAEGDGVFERGRLSWLF